MANEMAVRYHSGQAAEPVAWSVLTEIFDAIFGSDTRSLERYPNTLHNVHATWIDADCVQHEATSLADVERAYTDELTAEVRFSGSRQAGKLCRFVYQPGEPPRAVAEVQGHPSEVEAMIEPVRRAFPLVRHVVFISWSEDAAGRIAGVFRTILQRRLPITVEVFISESIAPGSDPLESMLEQNLRLTDAHVVVVTPEALMSHWVMWEAGASWARHKPVIPIFAGVKPGNSGPLGVLFQGVKIEDRTMLDRAIAEIADAVDAPRPDPLTEQEHSQIVSAQTSP